MLTCVTSCKQIRAHISFVKIKAMIKQHVNLMIRTWIFVGFKQIRLMNSYARIWDIYLSSSGWSAVARLVESKTGDPRVASSRLTVGEVTVLCPIAGHFISCLELVQPRKTENHLDMTEKLLTGKKHQQKQTNGQSGEAYVF